MPSKLYFYFTVWVASILVGGRLLAQDPSPLGEWRTIDDKTGKIRSTVLIYEQNGNYFGKIVSTISEKEAHDHCKVCPGDRKDKPIIGLVIMENMKKRGNDYGGGEVLDPDTGSIYRGKFKVTDGGQKLILRGYVGISLIGRSQTWIR